MDDAYAWQTLTTLVQSICLYVTVAFLNALYKPQDNAEHLCPTKSDQSLTSEAQTAEQRSSEMQLSQIASILLNAVDAFTDALGKRRGQIPIGSDASQSGILVPCDIDGRHYQSNIWIHCSVFTLPICYPLLENLYQSCSFIPNDHPFLFAFSSLCHGLVL